MVPDASGGTDSGKFLKGDGTWAVPTNSGGTITSIDITETGDALRVRYRNERRIEMAFEQSRYFDVRRWLIGPATQDMNSTGIVINEFADGRVEYSVHEVGQTRGRNERTNLLPILQDEMNRNTMLIQNPGY